MKRIIINIAGLLLLGTAAANAGANIPYSSDLFVNFSPDEGWKLEKATTRSGNNWEQDRNSTGDQFAVAGATAGAMYVFHFDYAADTWLISPAFTLTQGVEYTIGIWSRTSANYGEKENYRIKVGKDASNASSLKAGTTLIEKSNYSNLGDFEQFTATFTPSETGEYHFGIQCYSEENEDHLYVTHFTVTDGSTGGGGTTDPDTPDPDDPGNDEIKTLPYSFDFSSKDIFDSEWTQKKGPGSTNSATWNYNSSGWATLDADSSSLSEDDWLISPAIKIEEAGTYGIDYRVWANGKMEIILGTDKNDLQSFNTIVKTIENSVYSTDIIREVIEIETPGTYYVAFRACSESCQWMDQRVYYLGMKSEKPVPAAVTDLVALSDPNDGLSVSLSWTYPSLTNSGAALGSITSAELYRNGEVIKTFTDARPGSFTAYLDDEIESAGAYRYKVIVYNENGYDSDNANHEVSAGYVGKPSAEYPYSYNSASLSDLEVSMFTIEDANNDNVTWTYTTSYYGNKFTSELAEGSTEADDYLATPYVPLTAGYHKLTFTNGGQNQNFEMGYATNRHDLAGTFVMIGSASEGYSSDRHEFIVNIENAGDYVFVVRHSGAKQYASYYKNLDVTGFSIAPSQCLPQIVSGLTATGTPDYALISWTNPALDNAGLPLSEIDHIDILRNGTTIATLTNSAENRLLPGQECQYTDNSITEGGDYTYKVEVYNTNGKSEENAPEFTVYVGHGLPVPQASTDFHDWKVINNNNDYYDWYYNLDDEFVFSQYWGTADDYAMTPYIELEAGNAYQLDITMTTTNSDNYTLDIVAGQNYMPDMLAKVNEINLTKDEETTVSTYFKAVDAQNPAPTADEENDITYNMVPAGNNTFGLHATTMGQAKLISYSIEKITTVGVETVVAKNDKIFFNNGMVRTSETASHIRVITLEGVEIMSADNTDSLSLESIKGRIVVVAAEINGRNYSLTVKL